MAPVCHPSYNVKFSQVSLKFVQANLGKKQDPTSRITRAKVWLKE
jgi:hypothetical protein